MSSTLLNLKQKRLAVLALLIIGVWFFIASPLGYGCVFFNLSTCRSEEDYKWKSNNARVEVGEPKSKKEFHEKPTEELGKPSSTKPTPPVAPSSVEVDERGFWKGLDAVKEHAFDKPLATALVNFFQKEGISTLLELGAGMGLYAKMIKSETKILMSCYDGNPQTQDLSEGRCAVADFSKRMNFSRHEWVISLEVGEHIPKEFEDIFLGNIDRGNSKGAIVSWAVEGQGGHSHVNNHNNDYIRSKMSFMGYRLDMETENTLRAVSTFSWFRNTIMVFRK